MSTARQLSGIRRVPARAWMAVLGVGALVCSVGLTAAAFVQTIEIDGDLTGSIDIAQGPAPADQHSSPDDRKVVATVDDTAAALVTTLTVDPVDDPDQETTTIPITIQAVGDTLSSQVTVQVVNGGTADDVWGALLFGLYDQETPLLPGGVPVPAADLGSASALPVPAASEDAAATLTLKVWLAPDAPLAAYGSTPVIDVDIVGETVSGDVVDGKVVFR